MTLIYFIITFLYILIHVYMSLSNFLLIHKLKIKCSFNMMQKKF